MFNQLVLCFYVFYRCDAMFFCMLRNTNVSHDDYNCLKTSFTVDTDLYSKLRFMLSMHLAKVT